MCSTVGTMLFFQVKEVHLRKSGTMKPAYHYDVFLWQIILDQALLNGSS